MIPPEVADWVAVGVYKAFINSEYISSEIPWKIYVIVFIDIKIELGI